MLGKSRFSSAKIKNLTQELNQVNFGTQPCEIAAFGAAKAGAGNVGPRTPG